jgi:hypothetical protein
MLRDYCADHSDAGRRLHPLGAAATVAPVDTVSAARLLTGSTRRQRHRAQMPLDVEKVRPQTCVLERWVSAPNSPASSEAESVSILGLPPPPWSARRMVSLAFPASSDRRAVAPSLAPVATFRRAAVWRSCGRLRPAEPRSQPQNVVSRPLFPGSCGRRAIQLERTRGLLVDLRSALRARSGLALAVPRLEPAVQPVRLVAEVALPAGGRAGLRLRRLRDEEPRTRQARREPLL